MNFEVHGVPYFLTFHPGQGEWLLLTPDQQGLRRVAIVHDGPPLLPVVDLGLEPGDHYPLS